MAALAGRTVVITGAGGGIGRAIAINAAAEGANVVVADYGVALDGTNPRSEVADAVVAEIEAAGGSATAVNESVTSPAGAQAIIRAAVETYGGLDGVVCCAGVLRHRPFLEMSVEDFSFVVDTHLVGHFTVFQAAAQLAVASNRPVSLVAISSGYLAGDPTRANYRAAKAGVVALMKSVAMAGEGGLYRCNAIAPIANTRMTEASNMLMKGGPEDVAPMAVYLMSQASEQLNGQVFTVDGDRIATWQDAVENRMTFTSEQWTQAALAEQVPWLFQDTANRVTIRT